jgi:hypothetical protein
MRLHEKEKLCVSPREPFNQPLGYKAGKACEQDRFFEGCHGSILGFQIAENHPHVENVCYDFDKS